MIWKVTLQLHCQVLKILSRQYLLLFSHHLKRQIVSVSLCLCITGGECGVVCCKLAFPCYQMNEWLLYYFCDTLFLVCLSGIFWHFFNHINTSDWAAKYLEILDKCHTINVQKNSVSQVRRVLYGYAGFPASSRPTLQMHSTHLTQWSCCV